MPSSSSDTSDERDTLRPQSVWWVRLFAVPRVAGPLHSRRVTRLLHRHGVNMRLLGLVASCCRNPWVRRYESECHVPRWQSRSVSLALSQSSDTTTASACGSDAACALCRSCRCLETEMVGRCVKGLLHRVLRRRLRAAMHQRLVCRPQSAPGTSDDDGAGLPGSREDVVHEANVVACTGSESAALVGGRWQRRAQFSLTSSPLWPSRLTSISLSVPAAGCPSHARCLIFLILCAGCQHGAPHFDVPHLVARCGATRCVEQVPLPLACQLPVAALAARTAAGSAAVSTSGSFCGSFCGCGSCCCPYASRSPRCH